MRQFVRHPVDMPVEIVTSAPSGASTLQTQNISLGGLALVSSFAVSAGTEVEIRIAHVQPPFAAHARVAWCRASSDPEGFELGVAFLDAESAFLARMVEQVCQIEDYRKSVHRLEGREISSEEAAVEWIAKYAAQFPDIGPSQTH